MAQNRCVHIVNGWENCKNKPLLSVIAMCSKGTMFLKAIGYEGKVKDVAFIANIIIESYEMVGLENVVQFIINNAKNCTKASSIVEGTYGHVF